MRDDDDRELTGRERQALASLPHRATPPPELEERVVAALKARGLIRGGARWPRVAAIAASLLVLSLAYIGGVQVGAARTGGRQATFVLLIYDPIGGPPPPDVGAAVAEATAWAERLGREGVVVAGEKLENGGLRLATVEDRVQEAAEVPSPGSTQVLGGFFLVRADDYEHARQIASTCPLLRYGSTIEIRALEQL